MANSGQFKKGNPGGPGSEKPKYTQALGDEICERLAQGESLSSICKDEHMPAKSTIVKWAMLVDTPFAKQYAHAREIGYQHLADELIDIADTPEMGRERKIRDDGSVEVTEGDMLGHRTLRVNTRKWMLSKVLPKIYGDKVTQEHTGKDGQTLVPVLNVTIGKPKPTDDVGEP